MRISDWSSDVCSSDLHTGFDLVFRKPPSGIKRLTICHHMLTAQKGVESRKRGHGVDLSTCINAACDRQLHFDMVRPFLRLRKLDFRRPVAGYEVRVRLVDDKCIWHCSASRFQQRDIGAELGEAKATSEERREGNEGGRRCGSGCTPDRKK